MKIMKCRIPTEPAQSVPRAVLSYKASDTTEVDAL